MKMKEAMKEAKRTGKRQRVTEPELPIETRVNVNMRMDLDVLKGLKAEAERMGMPYQTLIHSILTRHLREGSIEERLANLERKVANKTG